MSDALSPRLRLGMQLVGVARRWRNALDQDLAALGLSDATWSPLMHIARAGDGLSQKDLAARIGVDGSSLVRVIDILAEKGLIERRQDAADRRANHLYLTDAGHAAVAAIQAELSRLEEAMLADLDDADIAALSAGLSRIDDRIRQLKAARGAK